MLLRPARACHTVLLCVPSAIPASLAAALPIAPEQWLRNRYHQLPSLMQDGPHLQWHAQREATMTCFMDEAQRQASVQGTACSLHPPGATLFLDLKASCRFACSFGDNLRVFKS